VSHVNVPRTTRRYTSPIREAGARRTRRAIVTAATDLFSTHGYAATSLTDVAEAAGVARPTVTAAFGSKLGLLEHVLDQALAGDDEPVPVAERPWFRPVWEATTQAAALDAYAEVCTLVGSRAARMFEVVRRAADGSPEAASLWATLQANRHAGAAMVIAQVCRLGPLTSAHDEAAATDMLWILNDPAHYDALVHLRGWPEGTFTTWLASQMRHAILAT
jgi:AcrR family transcriptional regulator